MIRWNYRLSRPWLMATTSVTPRGAHLCQRLTSHSLFSLHWEWPCWNLVVMEEQWQDVVSRFCTSDCVCAGVLVQTPVSVASAGTTSTVPCTQSKWRVDFDCLLPTSTCLPEGFLYAWRSSFSLAGIVLNNQNLLVFVSFFCLPPFLVSWKYVFCLCMADFKTIN